MCLFSICCICIRKINCVLFCSVFCSVYQLYKDSVSRGIMSCIASVWTRCPPTDYTSCSLCSIESLDPIAHLLTECLLTEHLRRGLFSELERISVEITRQLRSLDVFSLYLVLLGARLCIFTIDQCLYERFLKQSFKYVSQCFNLLYR